MSNNFMTDEQVYQLAEASDLLGEFGYQGEAALVGRVCDQEMTLLNNQHLGTESRKRAIMVNFDTLIETAKRISDNADSVQITSALSDLVSTFRPDDRDKIKEYLSK